MWRAPTLWTVVALSVTSLCASGCNGEHESAPRAAEAGGGPAGSANGGASDGERVSYMATLLFDDDTGTSGWLVYGYSDSWGDPSHYLVGHRIELGLP